MSIKSDLPSVEARFAALLHLSGLPVWFLLALVIELERGSKLSGAADFLRVAEHLNAYVGAKSLPTFEKLLEFMRSEGDPQQLAVILHYVDLACEEIAKSRSPSQEIAKLCVPAVKQLVVALRNDGIEAPIPFCLPPSNRAEIFKMAGLAGVANRAEERANSMGEFNDSNKESYRKQLENARQAAFEKANIDAGAFVKSVTPGIEQRLRENTRAFTNNAVLDEIRSYVSEQWTEAQTNNASQISVPLPDGSSASVLPLHQSAPGGVVPSLTATESTIVAFRRCGTVGGVALVVSGGLTVLYLIGTGGVGAPLLVLAGAPQVAGGAAWVASHWRGRDDDRKRWTIDCGRALQKHQIVLRDQFKEAWISAENAAEEKIERYFDIRVRQSILKSVSSTANDLADLVGT